MNQEWAQLFTPANVILGNVLIIILLLWSMIWKGIALWKAARKEDKVWYIVLLIFNTIGILEILYIFVFSKRELAKINQQEKK